VQNLFYDAVQSIIIQKPKVQNLMMQMD